MKKNAKYQLGKGLAFLGLAALTLGFAGCEKDPEKPNSPNNPDNPNNPQNTYNIEYVYNQNFKFHRVNDTLLIPSSAFIDTVAKHGANTNVKQIHIKPEQPNMWSTVNAEALMVSRANKFRNMYISSNNKLSGENTTLVLHDAVFNNSDVQNVLGDTLRINLVQR